MKSHYLDQRIRIKKPNLSLTEKKISDYFVHSESLLTQMMLGSLANGIDVSQSSVYQFVEKIGYSGFQKFKIDIARNSNYQSTLQNVGNVNGVDDISSGDDSITIAKKVLQANIHSLSSATQFLTKGSLDNVLALMYSAKTPHFFGQDGSLIVAFNSFHEFIRTNYQCNYIFGYHMQLSPVTKLISKDCVLIFFHSGKTKESANPARRVKKTSAEMITLTGNSGSELVGSSDGAIIIVAGEGLFRAGSLAP